LTTCLATALQRERGARWPSHSGYSTTSTRI
jgi:hypothetical protein